MDNLNAELFDSDEDDEYTYVPPAGSTAERLAQMLGK
jgi:hypothetical protein